MAQRTTEIITGLFMIAGLAAILVLALQVSGLSTKNAGETYTLYASFNDVGGISRRGKVAMAGVTVGSVRSVTLDRETFQARVELAIDADMDNIPADSSAVIRTSGLLGDQYIDISIGGDMDSLKPGDSFYSTQSAMNLERLITNFASGK